MYIGHSNTACTIRTIDFRILHQRMTRNWPKREDNSRRWNSDECGGNMAKRVRPSIAERRIDRWKSDHRAMFKSSIPTGCRRPIVHCISNSFDRSDAIAQAINVERPFSDADLPVFVHPRPAPSSLSCVFVVPTLSPRQVFIRGWMLLAPGPLDQ